MSIICLELDDMLHTARAQLSYTSVMGCQRPHLTWCCGKWWLNQFFNHELKTRSFALLEARGLLSLFIWFPSCHHPNPRRAATTTTTITSINIITLTEVDINLEFD